jgi:hypothetical protein
VLEGRHQGSRLAIIPPEVEYLDARIGMSQRVEDGSGSVAGPIIHKNDLGRSANPVESIG